MGSGQKCLCIQSVSSSICCSSWEAEKVELVVGQVDTLACVGHSPTTTKTRWTKGPPWWPPLYLSSSS